MGRKSNHKPSKPIAPEPEPEQPVEPTGPAPGEVPDEEVAAAPEQDQPRTTFMPATPDDADDGFFEARDAKKPKGHHPNRDAVIVALFRDLKAACEQKAPDTFNRLRVLRELYVGPAEAILETFDAHAPETKAGLMRIEEALRAEIDARHWR